MAPIWLSSTGLMIQDAAVERSQLLHFGNGSEAVFLTTVSNRPADLGRLNHTQPYSFLLAPFSCSSAYAQPCHR